MAMHKSFVIRMPSDAPSRGKVTNTVRGADDDAAASALSTGVGGGGGNAFRSSEDDDCAIVLTDSVDNGERATSER